LKAAYVQPQRLSRAEILSAKFGERSLLKCRECGGDLVIFETYPRKRAPPLIMIDA
jgi:hypothetical protein